MMSPLQTLHVESLVYGSIARGDVQLGSDIDVFLPSPPSPEIVETYLESAGVHSVQRQIIQATPNYAAKGYLFIDELKCYSFPLIKLKSTERDFYNFAGSVNFIQLLNKSRMPGVDKRLMLIEPGEKGHIESNIIGREGEIARILKVDLRIINERIRTLTRRQKIGHTGVYIKYDLNPEESFSEVFNNLVDKKPALKRRIRS
ncbi:hypothetical protein FJY84_01905 [Candidatus Bathyarchaeota archaeon]|nr:hypothetical protein [Candidatus Bathyarchaeota archaeon]